MLTAGIIFCIQYLPWIIVAIFVGFLFSKNIVNRQRSIITLALLTGAIAFTTGKMLNLLVINPRPFVVENVMPLIPHVADNGFPSEHTLFAFVLAIVTYTYDKKLGYVLLVLALATGVASVLAKVHSPLDILGSIAIGVVSLLLGQQIIIHPKVERYLSSEGLK